MNGIFMTAGNYKGEALAYLLKKAGKNFKAIVFVDDHERHTRRVYDTFSNSEDTEVITFRYAKEDETVGAFKAGSKNEVSAETKNLMHISQEIFKKN